MRTPLIAGNWKMNTTLNEAISLAKALRKDLKDVENPGVVVCPPFISLAAVWETLKGSSIGLGAQNMYFEDKGAYTGEISPLMVVPYCQYVILGHSERRGILLEPDEVVSRKVQAAVRHGLRPILCIGETLPQRQENLAYAVIAHQLQSALEDVPWWEHLVVAYEPVWAIGTGHAATGPQAQETVSFIRGELAELYGSSQAQEVRILYGGSVTRANIAQFVSQPDIDGALVGGASLNPADFISIVAQTADLKRGT